KMAGTRLRTVSSRKNCSAVALSEPGPPSSTLTPGALMLVVVDWAKALPEKATSARLASARARPTERLEVIRLNMCPHFATGGTTLSRDGRPDRRPRRYSLTG